jgi:hypothetical protein
LDGLKESEVPRFWLARGNGNDDIGNDQAGRERGRATV